MKVYQDITGYNKSIIDLNISLDNTDSPFCISLGCRGSGVEGLITSGILFSGYEGYIFDISGSFVGGYKANKQFKITTHIHDDSYFSYYIDDVLIKNNISGDSTINRIEFDKYGDSTISISHRGNSDDKFILLTDSYGNILISSDNIILTI